MEKTLPSKWLLPEMQDFVAPHEEARFEALLPLLQKHLLAPIEDIMQRPSKGIRSELVTAGFEFARASNPVPAAVNGDDDRHNLLLCCQAVELLHAGSLIIDDIQDHSRERRGRPCVHRLYGTETALSVGNWLYFWPLRLLGRLRLDPASTQVIYSLYHRALEQAHYGQVLDVSVDMMETPQAQVFDVCNWVVRNKTGALIALALQLGALVSGGSSPAVELIGAFGWQYGCALQNFDDLANARGQLEPQKKFEDLKARRPSWVWCCVAEHFASGPYADFVHAVAALPDEAPVERWFQQHDFFALAGAKAVDYLAAATRTVVPEGGDTAPSSAQQRIQALGEMLRHAYV